MTAFMQSSAQEDIQSQLPDARVISKAAIPEKPAFPNKPLYLFIALFLGASLGVLLAFVFEYLDVRIPSFRTDRSRDRTAGNSPCARRPVSRLRKKTLAEYVLQQPASAFAEAIHSICTWLTLTGPQRATQVGDAGIGGGGRRQSDDSLALARQRSGENLRVLIIYAGPSGRWRLAHRFPGLGKSPGLSEFSRAGGQVSEEEIIQEESLSGADMIVNGNGALDNIDFRHAPRLRSLLDALRPEYQLIIINFPRFLLRVSGYVLSAVADEILLVVRWGEPKADRSLCGPRDWQARQANSRGNIVPGGILKKHATYGYGDSGYYSGKLAKSYPTS